MYIRLSVLFTGLLVSFYSLASVNSVADYYIEHKEEAKAVNSACKAEVEELMAAEKVEEAANLSDSTKCKAARKAINEISRQERKIEDENRKKRYQEKKSDLMEQYLSLSVAERTNIEEASKNLGLECHEMMGCQSLQQIERQYVKQLSNKIGNGDVDIDDYYQQCLAANYEKQLFSRDKSECDVIREEKVEQEALKLQDLEFTQRLENISNCATDKPYDVCIDANKFANKKLDKSSTLSKNEKKELGSQCIDLLSEAKDKTKDEFKRAKKLLGYMYECKAVRNKMNFVRY
ncbi:hypothetical protein [Vibrio amylolyticus]|uniref:hypothetical protein n=1 Tax=Vibrio amylolyticus TaxID=2847292 RepID=UPI00354B62E3